VVIRLKVTASMAMLYKTGKRRLQKNLCSPWLKEAWDTLIWRFFLFQKPHVSL